MACSGIVTAGLAVAGRQVSPTVLKTSVESWNGSAWTEVGDVNTARYAAYGSKVDYSNMFASGGYSTTVLDITEVSNGSSWT